MKLPYSRRALQQIDRALAYIAKQSPLGAVSVQTRLLEILAPVQQHPNTGKKTSINDIRRVFLTPYLYMVDYSADSSEIVVLLSRHAGRRPVA